MSVGLQPASGEEARGAVLRALGLSHQAYTDVLGPSLCAEALRAALWAEWSAASQPVYVTRLINAAARMLLPWRECAEDGAPADDEQLRTALQELEVIGDLAGLPGGRWAPAPLRLVPLPAIGRHLLLGGTPTKMLSPSLQAVIERAGVARLVRADPKSLGLKLDTLPAQEWLRTPSADLRTWTCSVLDTPCDEEAGDLAVDVYAPAACVRGADQFHRWTQRVDRLPDGKYLARSHTRRGSTAYYIVQIARGRVETAAQPRLGDGDVRRLMYGLDMLAGNPVRVLAERRRDQWSFELRSELPRAEHRLFLTIGRERARTDGRYYPRWWDVPTPYVGAACDALRDLGVRIDER